MSEVSRRRSDELGYLVTVLKLSTIDLYERAWAAEEDFCRGFYDSGLARPRGSKKQHGANRPTGHIHSGQKDLVHVHHPANGAFLADHARSKLLLER